MTRKSIIQLFRVIIAVTFIFSAISKLISLHFFDDLVAELLLGKNYNTNSGALYYIQILTRGLIAVELLLGAAVMQTKNLKNLILPTIQILLVVFTLHLIYVSVSLMNNGKTFTEAFTNGNCGCFGDILPMSNLESILKNIVSMLLVGYLWYNVNKERRSDLRFKSYTLPLMLGFITFGSLLLTVKSFSGSTDAPIIVEYNEDPVEEIQLEKQDSSKVDTSSVVTVKETTSEAKEEKIPKETLPKQQKEPKKLTYIDLLKNYKNFSNGVIADLSKGKKLVCMFSLSCTHCQGTYKQLCNMNDSGKLPNTFLLNNGKKFEENFFYSQAGCQHPNILIEDYLEFKKLLNGNSFPYIIYLENGKITKSWTSEDLEDPNNPDLSNTDKIKSYFGIKDQKQSPINNSPIQDQDDEEFIIGG